MNTTIYIRSLKILFTKFSLEEYQNLSFDTTFFRNEKGGILIQFGFRNDKEIGQWTEEENIWLAIWVVGKRSYQSMLANPWSSHSKILLLPWTFVGQVNWGPWKGISEHEIFVYRSKRRAKRFEEGRTPPNLSSLHAISLKSPIIMKGRESSLV